MPKKMVFARLDFSTFLICRSGDLSDNESDEKPSVAFCGGSICILTGLQCDKVNKKVKEMAYNTYVRPQLEYCSTIWSPWQKNSFA